MSKLFEMLRIGICPIRSLIIKKSGLNLVGLVPGTRVDWIGKKRNELEKNLIKREDWRGMARKELDLIGLD